MRFLRYLKHLFAPKQSATQYPPSISIEQTATVISHYEHNFFVLREDENYRKIAHSSIISTNVVLRWEIKHFQELNEHFFSKFLEIIKPFPQELIVLGTGNKQYFLPPHYLAELATYKKTIECMTTISAYKTYNILCSENRPPIGVFIIEAA